MRLLGLLLIIAWYTLANQMSKTKTSRKATGWQVRCLNCQTTRTATESQIVRISGRATKRYALADCETCNRKVGMAVERAAVAAEVIA